jgi:acyl-CoA thioesterase-1
VHRPGFFNRLAACWRSRSCGQHHVAAATLAGLLLGLPGFAAAQSAAGLTPAEPGAAQPLRLMVIGDSLTAGFGLPVEQAFPARLEAALRDKGHAVTVLNAGVSGDTSAGGKARIAWALADKPDAVLLELGANDGLRGIDPKALYANLSAILETLQAKKIPTFLAGMYAPPNLGAAYGEEFRGVYARLAKEFDVPLQPFFLDGVAMKPALNQADGIHPNAAGVAILVDNILPMLEPWLAGIRPPASTAGR